jgi:Tol biopolymer transport system component
MGPGYHPAAASIQESYMTLAAGNRLGPYEVLGSLGAGGMGEVYRAHDTKLKREVAIKVLPEAFARDEERMKRFEREAYVLASLNHPNVAAIYGLEEANGVRALVLELVEGPTLAERIAAGPVPLEETIRIGIQMAQGLEAAHEKAIIHRDLKPANVKLTKDGDVKILDFGLAKALEAESSIVEATSSPTLTRAATHVGVLLGTAAYMSPEQAKGKAADRRADVWAFGVVLYEMLTARRAFAGEDVSDTLACVLTKDPDWSTLPVGVPARLRGLLARCLTKDPKKRLQAIGEARITLEDASGTPETAAGVRAVSSWWVALAGVAGLALVAGVAVGALWPRSAPPPAAPLTLRAELGADASLVMHIEEKAAVLSPDGILLAFVGRTRPAAPPLLYVRRLQELEASPLPGTEGARNPFFSPDSQWIAFFAGGNLKKIAVTGGATLTLCSARNDRGGTWTEDGALLFAPDSSEGVGLSQVASAGGTPEVLTTPDPAAGEFTHRWPQALPGGKAVLYTASARMGSFNDASIIAERLPRGPKKVLLRGGYHGRYLPSGHLVYIHDGTLFAAAFDLDRLEVIGSPAPAVEGVMSSPLTAGAQFANSDRGALVYLAGKAIDEPFAINWVDRAGKSAPLLSALRNYAWPRFSADGRRLAVDVIERNQRDVWVYELGRGSLSRLTFDQSEDTRPAWTPDGQRVVFASARSGRGTWNLFWQRVDGTGEAERLTDSENRHFPGSWHPSGRFLAFVERNFQKGTLDLLVLPMEGDEASGLRPGKPTAFLNTPFAENNPRFSPDGRWLAYESDESGRLEVYVRPFPGPGGKWQVSTEGASNPMWSETRHELFYFALDQRIMVAPYTVEGDSFRADKPRSWSEAPLQVRPGPRSFDLHPDGQRFAVVSVPPGQPEATEDRVVFILNFFDYLRRIAPPKGSR